ncbi:Glycoside hydrolase family 71 [Penicillium verrucosum]|uniref:Glycoside hydrolase family 71 n=1 Tax=Penicillium verrucosum TaxID=60171 RepID=UPI0025450371|nr:Glycoside hydrolase family 71 [Penicillium verrucosum]KAJ5926375.1 Glycoside hydrolase family 71 [Penicillium verrucosum]
MILKTLTTSYFIPIGIGRQSFKVIYDRKTVNSLYRINRRDITNTYPYSIYNFNAYIGTLPAEAFINRLQPARLALLS